MECRSSPPSWPTTCGHHFPCSTTSPVRSGGGIAGRTKSAPPSASPSTARPHRILRSRFATATRSSRTALRQTRSRAGYRNVSMTTATSLSLGRLRRDGQAFVEELTREYYLATAGHKPTAELQPIYKRHSAILGRDAFDMTLEAFRSATPGSEDHRQTRILLDWLVDSQIGRELAPLEEREIAWEASALLTLTDGTKLQFERAPIEMANSTDRARRLAIDAARSTLVSAELAPLRRERFQRERDITESLGLANGYNATWELLSGISLGDLRAQCEQFLRDTQAAWDETFPEFVKRVLGIEPREAKRSDAL